MDHYAAPQTYKEARGKFSEAEVRRVKEWMDKKVYDQVDDPSQVFECISANAYLKPLDYKGSCVLSTLTNSIGCRFATTMK